MDEIRKALERALADIEDQRRRVILAIKALDGEPEAPSPAPEPKKRQRRKRRPPSEHAQRVLALMKARPEVRVSGSMLKREHGMASTTADQALELLERRGRIEAVGKTSRGKPIYTLAGTDVEPVQNA